MSFVHGHAREATWVVSHLRAPNRPEGDQLPLDDVPGEPDEGTDVPAIPGPRPAADDLSPASRPGP
jgi:hypothetical protein